MNGRKIEIGIATLYGRILEQASTYAKTVQVAEEDITSQLGTLLLLGSSKRAEDTVRLSSMRVSPTELDQRVRKVERRGRPRKSSTRKTKGGGTGSKIKAYWAKMSKEQRAAEMKRRMNKRAA